MLLEFSILRLSKGLREQPANRGSRWQFLYKI